MKPFPLVPVLIAAIILLALAGLLLFWPHSGRNGKTGSAPAQTSSETVGVETTTSAGPEKAPEAAKASSPAVPAATAPDSAAISESAPKVAEPAAKPAPEPAPVVPPAAASVSSKRTRPAAPVKSYKVPRTIPKEGFKYRIGWGDTLWDISEAFYRNPWLYPRIARFNKIRNPDLIISGTFIRIPPKN
jgi:nucleoid-associated protein YgaU